MIFATLLMTVSLSFIGVVAHWSISPVPASEL
jgi:hypothetical protein